MNLESVVLSDMMNQVVETNNASPDTVNAGVNDCQQLEANNILSKIIDICQMPAYICCLDKDFQKHAASNLIYKLTVNYDVSNIHAYNLYTGNWKTYGLQQKMVDKLCEMFKASGIFMFYLRGDELNESIIFLAEDIKDQLFDNKLAKWLLANCRTGTRIF